jgi:hypothetical protein
MGAADFHTEDPFPVSHRSSTIIPTRR